MTEEKLSEIEARKTAAFDMVISLCKNRDEYGRRDWIMSIPARPDYDPDLVIGSSLHDIPDLIAALREERERSAKAIALLNAMVNHLTTQQEIEDAQAMVAAAKAEGAKP